MSSYSTNQQVTIQSCNINRKRNIIWLNLSFSNTVSTKISHCFLNILDENFLKYHENSSIFNKSNVLSQYSWTKNIKMVNIKHNKMIPKKSETLNKKQMQHMLTKRIKILNKISDLVSKLRHFTKILIMKL